MKKLILLFLIFIFSSVQAGWVRQFYNDTIGLYTVFPVDSLHIFAGGDKGMVLISRDGGNTWEWSYTGRDFVIWDIYFVDTLKGWVVGKDTAGTKFLIHTQDGGRTWIIQLENDTMLFAYEVQFIDSLRGYIGGKYLYKTEDGGWTWIKLPEGSGPFHFLNWAQGFCITPVGLFHAGDTLRYTEDGGFTWIKRPIVVNDTSEALSRIIFLDTLKGYGRGWLGGSIFFTADQGITWNKKGVFFSNNMHADFFFLNDILGWVPQGFGIYHTYDGGNTWTYEQIQGLTYQVDVRFIDENHGWAVGYYPWLRGNEGEVHKWEPTYISENVFRKNREIRIIYEKQGILFDLKDAEIEIFNVTGRKIKEFRGRFLFKPEKSGIYFYLIKSKNKIFKGKIIGFKSR